ncbi:MAG: crossover junction endodeoxyribonuclease RuvC [Myxococcales bacterium]|nr:crossover junction endodeoxyribonuclease RuvC [Polyangiaceae bacterium]MDW8247708.1 crossover junction endodeoxyribonuclease RuvC [Myxococcales bacterium]
MLVLGIDPGTRHLGWGLVQAEGTQVKHVAHGIIHPPTDLPLAERLVVIDDTLHQILTAHHPEGAGVESLFFGKDAQAAAKLGHARGVVLLGLQRAQIPFAEYAPTLIKRTVVGTGLADKRQVAMVITALLRLPRPPPLDAADALAIAITHARVSHFPRLVVSSPPRLPSPR